jgi:hypothetical protein
MSYEIFGDTECLGQFASGKGYNDLIEAAKDSPALNKLIDAGESSDVAGVIEELNKIEGPADVVSTATGLAKMIQGQKSILISNGLVKDETPPAKLDPAALHAAVKQAAGEAITPKMSKKLRKLSKGKS